MRGRLALFVLISIIDVRVRAAQYSDQPESCLSEKSYPCAVKNHSLTQNLKFNQLTISPGAVVQLQSEKLSTLVHGEVLVDSAEMVVSTLYANVMVNGVSLVSYKSEVLMIEVYKGESVIEEENLVLAGMSSIIPGFNKKGELIVESPRPLMFDLSKKKWQDMSLNEISEKQINNLKSQIKKTVESATNIYKKEVLRQIASHKNQLERQRLWRLKKQQEIEALNNLFKKKNYLTH